MSPPLRYFEDNDTERFDAARAASEYSNDLVVCGRTIRAQKKARGPADLRSAQNNRPARLFFYLVNACAAEAADQPEDEQHDQDQAEHAAQTAAAVGTVGVVAAAAAEDHDEKNNDEDQAHERVAFRVKLRP
jgi:hypothetical protein